jgi:hypothetical protein
MFVDRVSSWNQAKGIDMTFSVMLINDNQRQVVGTLWTDDEAKAQALVPELCRGSGQDQVFLCRTESREIPLRLAQPGTNFC